MSRRNAYWAVACLAVFSAVLVSQRNRKSETAAALPAASVGNLLTNPGFEDASGGVPAGWVLDPKFASRGQVSVENSALKLAPNSRNNRKEEPFSVGQLIAAAPVRGRRLTVRTSMRTEGGAAAFTLVFALAKGRPVGQAVFTQTDSTPQFVSQEGSLDVPSQAEQIIFSCATNSTEGAVWFKDLYLGGGDAPQAAAAPRARSVGELTASAVIDAAKTIRTIPKELFGTNIEWVRNGNGVWDQRAGEPRPEMARLARELGVTMVRYPGGGFADYYHWRQGVGKSRPTVKNVLDPGSSPIWFGTAELMKFCRAIDAVPMLTANVVTGTAEEAAAWVAYCNRPGDPERAKDGSAEPFGVKYWEIGNEQYIKNTPTAGINAPMDAHLSSDAYIRKFREYARAMKQADPSILTGAIGGLNFGRYTLVHDNNWNRALLQQAGAQIDFLAIHNGYAPLVVAEPKPPSFTDTYRAMLAFPTQVERNLQDIDRQIRSHVPSEPDRISIAVTEWGPLFAFLPDNPWVDHCKTLGSAMYVAGMMQAFLRSPRVGIATFFKFTDDSFGGWVTAGGQPKATYYALQMFTQHFGTRLVSTTTTSPGYSNKAVGMVAAASDVPYLDLVSSLSADGSKLHVIAVNRNMDDAVKTRLELRSFRPAGSGTAWVLTAPSLDANNGRDVVGSGWAKQVSADREPLFSRGAPNAVAPQQQPVSEVAASFSYTFAPRSVTALQLTRAD